ncbi:RNA-binding protein [Thermus scotoductus]|uniref:RNA-binding protein n=1 Tax=Thermus scotoductus TaxID=37636 RepID=A0A430R713_THESC|nr:RNA-binding protein [Thermus scotoductus]RTG95300.1 RNA-binding protein [Thermus scotoductus]RTH03113.1 RNA-binding protein [Thermus scotoductus]RTH18844.1 RNA-binding protein [Thermus scotoductus]RTH99625.1 RNA-binding protein [Thermus scotoductus]RTI20903.1 RNA-binding protein [Thermus scotoductus]
MADLMAYLKRARGGRVVETGFLDPEEQALLEEKARGEGLKVAFFGGFPLAERRLAVLYPPEVPSVHDPVEVVFLEKEPPDLGEAMGDLEAFGEGYLVAVSAKGRRALEEAGYTLFPPPEGALRVTSERVRTLVVPSLRVDTVGAKGFGVSRSYFVQGVRAGKVRLRGKVASPKEEMAPGDTLLAEGLGSLRLLEVLGETRRGNYKIKVEVER